MDFISYSSIALFGACIGSFLNVLILRLPKKETLGGRSHCQKCLHVLGTKDLIPIVSYLFLSGRCAHCKKRISVRYVLIEVITAFLFLVTWFLIRPAAAPDYLELFRAWFLVSLFLVVFVIDLEHYLILDRIIIPGVIAIIIVNFLLDSITGQHFFSLGSATFGGIISAFSSSFPFFALWYFSGGAWMGFGDVKLVVFLALALGWPYIWICLLLSFFLGTLISIPLLISGKKHMASKLPFGTFLAASATIVLFFGSDILLWYQSLVNLFY
jgi:leader peptidase (prepilin peptidase) / N-methyltransferase